MPHAEPSHTQGVAPCGSGCAVTPPTAENAAAGGHGGKKTPSGCPPFGEMHFRSYFGVVRMWGISCGPAPWQSLCARVCVCVCV
jgi:hypothetical protein